MADVEQYEGGVAYVNSGDIFDFENQKSRRLLSWTHYRGLLKVEATTSKDFPVGIQDIIKAMF